MDATGPNTITAREKFAEEIDIVWQKGYALADQEHATGIRAVGVPVLGPDGNALAAISIASPTFRMSVEDCIDVVPMLTESARNLRCSYRGGTPPPADPVRHVMGFTSVPCHKRVRRSVV